MKRFVRGFTPAARALDWFEMVWLLYFVGCGIVAGLVIEILMDEVSG